MRRFRPLVVLAALALAAACAPPQGRWYVVDVPDPALPGPTERPQLNAVSCPTPSTCIAVGQGPTAILQDGVWRTGAPFEPSN